MCRGFGVKTFALVSVVVVDVAILALALRVIPTFLVFAHSYHALAPVTVVTVVAHPFRKMLQVCVRAFCDYPWLPPTSSANRSHNHLFVILIVAIALMEFCHGLDFR